MKPPIFVYEPIDLSVFESVEAAELGVKPIDVLNNEYLYFDSEGTVLVASVTRDNRGIERTVIRESSPMEFNEPGLTQILKVFFAALDYPRQELENMSLSSLVQESLKYKTR